MKRDRHWGHTALFVGLFAGFVVGLVALALVIRQVG